MLGERPRKAYRPACPAGARRDPDPRACAGAKPQVALLRLACPRSGPPSARCSGAQRRERARAGFTSRATPIRRRLTDLSPISKPAGKDAAEMLVSTAPSILRARALLYVPQGLPAATRPSSPTPSSCRAAVLEVIGARLHPVHLPARAGDGTRPPDRRFRFRAGTIPCWGRATRRRTNCWRVSRKAGKAYGWYQALGGVDMRAMRCRSSSSTNCPSCRPMIGVGRASPRPRRTAASRSGLSAAACGDQLEAGGGALDPHVATWRADDLRPRLADKVPMGDWAECVAARTRTAKDGGSGSGFLSGGKERGLRQPGWSDCSC